MELSKEGEAAYAAARTEYDVLTEQYDSAEELPYDVDQWFGELKGEIKRIDDRPPSRNILNSPL